MNFRKIKLSRKTILFSLIGIAGIAFVISFFNINISLPKFEKKVVKQEVTKDGSVIYFENEKKTVLVGENFSMDVHIDPVGKKITGTEVHINFDKNYFQVDDVKLDDSQMSLVLQKPIIDNATGKVSFVVAIPATDPVVPVTAKSKIATLTMKSLSLTSGSNIEFATSTFATAIGEVEDVLSKRKAVTVSVEK